MELIFFAGLFIVGYFFGSINERKHYASIEKREQDLARLPVTTTKHFSSQRNVKDAKLITGSAVISLDHFKRMLSGLRAFFGGNIGSYETLIDRARREAVLRLKEQVGDADLVANLRIETSAIGASADMKRSIGSIEAVAYGTAVWYG